VAVSFIGGGNRCTQRENHRQTRDLTRSVGFTSISQTGSYTCILLYLSKMHWKIQDAVKKKRQKKSDIFWLASI
jgi:hypothetical protein